MFRKRIFWTILTIVLALGGGAYGYYHYVHLPGQEPEETVMMARVARGDLVMSVSGTGVLYPARERDLGFQTESGDEVTGYLDEVLVEVGDRVKEGDVLARLQDEDLKAALLKATIDLRAAELDLAEVTETATEAEVADAQAALESARLALTVTQLGYENAQKSPYDADVRDTHIAVRYHTEQMAELEASGATDDVLAEAWSALHKAEAAFNEALQKADMEHLEAWNQVDQARNNVLQAEANLETLKSRPDEQAVLRAQLKVDRAELALEEARESLAAAELRAAFDGIVVDVAAISGERVGADAVITLADLQNPVMRFWVEQSDLGGVAVGNRVEIAFEGLPDQRFTGEVVRIDPKLVTVDNTLAVQTWASLDFSGQEVNLLGDMNADVEVISAEAHDAVLVPIQALREIGDGQYAAFIVGDDGELTMRVIEIGLRDAVNAEVVSGLDEGERVSLGQSLAATGASQEDGEQMPGAPGGMMPGGGIFGGGGLGGGGRR